ncbi:helix-turn-helix domain-containing protein [Ectobacillus ponti]|uniref:Helix-turn-helix domain-containing protein n=1 Tax=Ectobacillus ponti TaxID=2961894 RepID=A0AA41X7L2_9BACI|nr:helix-turn-helix domain-containing protein [Ectobacillus ponti]MCP8967763.1 helix-turn-helix domain-containing protein [Ectobacillus ponti]
MHHDAIRVAIADDESMIRNGIQRLVSLHGDGWDIVGSFKNGKELLESGLQFDLLITDVKMPLMDGLTLIRELRRQMAFEAIVISGFDDFPYLQTAIREGAADYILKPIDREEFFGCLSKVQAKIRGAKKQGFVMWTPSLEEQQRIHARGNQTVRAEDLMGQLLPAVEQVDRQAAERLLQRFFQQLNQASLQEIEKCIQSLYVQTVSLLVKDGSLQEVDVSWDGSRLSTLAQVQEYARVWLGHIMNLLENRYRQRKADPIALAKQWIAQHLHESITIERIAKEVYMNTTYLSEQFKSQTGETVLDYVTRLRLQKAKELLLRSDLKVYEISQQVGYADTKYFSKLFKKHFGELPSQFKEKLQQ